MAYLDLFFPLIFGCTSNFKRIRSNELLPPKPPYSSLLYLMGSQKNDRETLRISSDTWMAQSNNMVDRHEV
jgi:hypothetical protein